MKKIFFGILFISLASTACATGPGTAEGNMGSAGLFMQLQELSDGESLESADGFQITLEEFLIFFSGGSLVNRFFDQGFSEPFLAELFEGELTEIIEVDPLAGVEYEALNLVLGLGAAHGHDHEEIATQGEEELEEELSVLIHGEAQSGDNTCQFTLEFIAPDRTIEVNTEEQSIPVTRDSETVVPILFDQGGFFAHLSLGAECTGAAEIHLEGSPELLDQFLDSFLLGEVPEAEEFGEEGGHGHSHG